MTSRSRFLAILVAAVLVWGPTRSPAQDTPLYRDPSPTEGPRINGPLLSPRPPTPNPAPPPPSGLGPFQVSSPGPGPGSPSLAVEAEPIREPLLGVQPMPPPLPAMIMQPMPYGQDVEIKRTTKIRGPNGLLGRFHEWFHDTCFGPPRPVTTSLTTAPKRGLFGAFHSTPPGGEAPTRFFNWPTWPTWPLSAGR